MTRFLIAPSLLISSLLLSGSVVAQSSEGYEISGGQFTMGSSGEATSESFGVESLLGQGSPSGVASSETFLTDSGTTRLAVGKFLPLMEISRVDVKWHKSEFSLKAQLELPPDIIPSSVSPEGRVVFGISSLGAVLDEKVLFTVHGANSSKWEFKNMSAPFGVTSAMIDWQGVRFDYAGSGLILQSRHIGAASTTLDVNYAGLQEDEVQFQLGDVRFAVQNGEGIRVIANPMAHKIIIDSDENGEAEMELPYSIESDMDLLVTSGETSDVVLVGDYMTAAIGHLNVKARFDSRNTDVDILVPTVVAQVTIGARLFSGSDTLGTAEWKSLDREKWKSDHTL